MGDADVNGQPASRDHSAGLRTGGPGGELALRSLDQDIDLLADVENGRSSDSSLKREAGIEGPFGRSEDQRSRGELALGGLDQDIDLLADVDRGVGRLLQGEHDLQHAGVDALGARTC